jgi:glycosyltransferase involved in cell wall biosynthesis
MKITVILCTYNRCETLAKALDSIARSTLPGSVDWEVLVVDNNSQDETRKVTEDFCRRFPGRFRHLFEPQQGKSYALNTGIREAQGDVLAFMDDDATVGPEWLGKLTGGLLDGEWAGAGGRIILEWPASLPGWLAVDGPLARHPFPGFDKGHEATQLIGPPFGANMAFRKEMFKKYGGFRTDLGPSPNRDVPRPNEDTEFGRRLIAAGERLRYEPSAVVYHPVPEDRINKKYFLEWHFDNGRADAREFRVRPVREFSRLAVWTLRWTVALEPRARFFRKLVVWQKAGKLVECYRQSRGATRQ